MEKKILNLKKALESEVKDEVRRIKRTGQSLQEMTDILAKKAVQKRLLTELRKSPATSLNYNELFKVCRLAYDGTIDNAYDFEDKFTEVGKDFNNLNNLNKIFSPLGNMIIGVKTIKDYCQDYVTDKEYETLKEHYDKAKTKTNEVLGSMVDELGVWESEAKNIGREHGVFPETGRTPPVLYNIEEIGIRYPELSKIVNEIKLFKKKYPDKEIMSFKGVKTAAFKKFLKRYI